MNDIDLVGSLSRVAIAPKSQTNNTGAFICDLEALNFTGVVAVNLNIGVKTAGDSDGAITLRVLSSATNNISNGTNTGTNSTFSVSTTNNTATNATIGVDTRAVAGRYLFYGVALTGTNSPAYPISVVLSGQKKVN